MHKDSIVQELVKAWTWVFLRKRVTWRCGIDGSGSAKQVEGPHGMLGAAHHSFYKSIQLLNPRNSGGT